MTPYASYKPSGVPWLGVVPSHWIGKRLRDCVEGCFNGVWGEEPDGGNDDIPVIRVADFDRNRRQVFEHETLRKVESGQRESRGLVLGDMLMEKSGGGEQQPVGMVVSYLMPKNAVCSNFVARMRSREGVISRFMVYLHAHLYVSRVTNISVKQTTGIQNLDSTAYLSEACFIPPSEEQQSIANYLDVETARIDTLIHEKNELIGLLQEWRHSMLVETLTHGVDMSGDLINSNIYWLGDVPSKWKIKTLFQLNVHIETGKVDVNIQQEDGDYPFFTCGREIKRASQYSFDCEALLIAGNGEVGFTNYYNGKFEAYQRTYVLSNFVEADPNYLAYYVKTFLKQAVVAESNGSVIQFITLKDLRHFKVLLPPLSEQLRAVQLLNKSLTNIDELITHTNEEIVLLEELRAATIADVVLGRIDVRPK